jgi:hypothetical protein
MDNREIKRRCSYTHKIRTPLPTSTWRLILARLHWLAEAIAIRPRQFLPLCHRLVRKDGDPCQLHSAAGIWPWHDESDTVKPITQVSCIQRGSKGKQIIVQPGWRDIPTTSVLPWVAVVAALVATMTACAIQLAVPPQAWLNQRARLPRARASMVKRVLSAAAAADFLQASGADSATE